MPICVRSLFFIYIWATRRPFILRFNKEEFDNKDKRCLKPLSI